jgi:hypothetical protein
MNWRFTRAGEWIRFEENEPIAFFFPVERGRAEQFQPRIERLEDAPELRAAFEKWSESRNAFQKWVVEAKPTAPAEKWQKLYFRGLDSDGKKGRPTISRSSGCRPSTSRTAPSWTRPRPERAR